MVTLVIIRSHILLPGEAGVQDHELLAVVVMVAEAADTCGQILEDNLSSSIDITSG